MYQKIYLFAVIPLICAPLISRVVSGEAGPTTQQTHTKQVLAYKLRLELSNVRGELRSITERLNVSPDVLETAAARLDEQWESISLERTLLEARQRAIQVAENEASARAEELVRADEVGKQLEEVVKVRQSNLDQLTKVYKGLPPVAIPPGPVEDARVALAEARAKLAERRQEVATAGGRDTLAAWDREQRTIMVDREVLERRAQAIAMRRAHFEAAIPLIERERELEEEIHQERAEVLR